MLPSRPRSGSFEAGLRSSLAGSNSKAASSSSSSSKSITTSSDSRRRLERSKSTSKASPSPEKRGAQRGAEMTQQRVAQLEEELRKEREEKSQALQELAEFKKREASLQKNGSEKLQILEKEVEKAKESERKMLESLIYQTKQLEQTKISLEEAKLEIVSLQESNRNLEVSARNAKNGVFGRGVEEEIRVLRGELRSAMHAEEKSRKALDDVAMALSDVTMEAKQVKIWLSEAQTELEEAKAEGEHYKAALESAEEKLRWVTEEYKRFKFEAEESISGCNEREKVFVDCMKASEAEVNKAKQENVKLIESQRVIRDENARLRDIIKQAVGEANVVKESLEITRNENSRLMDVMSQKENALQSLKQEYECLKVSEAAAQGSLKELNNLLAATTRTTTPVPIITTSMPEPGMEQQPQTLLNGDKFGETETRMPSEHWKSEKPRLQNGRRHSIGEPTKFNGALLEAPKDKDRMFASLSNIADMKSAASAAMDDLDDEFDHIGANHLDGMQHSMKQKKRRPILRKFGDLFRRRGSHKSNLISITS